MKTVLSPQSKDKLIAVAERTSENEFVYRSVSKAAVASMVFAVLGALTAFLAQVFVLLPALGVGFGFVALVARMLCAVQ